MGSVQTYDGKRSVIDLKKADIDEIRNAWYDEVDDGLWTIDLPVHPADEFNKVPDDQKRLNYTMWIECVYSSYMVVTDPQTEIFVEVPHFRDAYLISVNLQQGKKSAYVSKGGHSMSKQDSSTFTCKWDKFDLWQIAYNGRICLTFGTVPQKEENGGSNRANMRNGKPRLGVWTRSDLQKVFGAKQTDEYINRAFLGLGHGDPDEKDGFLTNGALKRWKKTRVAPSDTEEAKTRYQLRGRSAKPESAPK